MKNNKKVVFDMICLFFMAIFFYHGIYKLVDLQQYQLWLKFAPYIHKYASQLAYIIPIGELTVSLLFIVHKYRPVLMYTSFILWLLFLGYIISGRYYHIIVLEPYRSFGSRVSWDTIMFQTVGFAWVAFIGILFIPLKGLNKNKTEKVLRNNTAAFHYSGDQPYVNQG